MPQLLQTLHADAIDFLSKAGVSLVQKLCNEHAFQLYLSQYLLQSKHYDDVLVEYLVEKDSLRPYITAEDEALLKERSKKLYVDIVVEKDGEYALLELKFPLYLYSDFHPKRFGEAEVIDKKTSTAQNNTCYNYWKDVRRIELIQSRYSKVIGGIALLLTNAPAYWGTPRKESEYRGVAIYADRDLSPRRAWLNPDGVELEDEDYPSFTLDRGYQPAWIDVCEAEKIKFRACTVVVY